MYSLSTLCLKKLHLVKVGAFAWYSVKIRVIYGVRFERRKVDKKSKPTGKLKHTNSILEYFEYFCQMSSKSILIIMSYTVSKLAHFWVTVHIEIFSISSLSTSDLLNILMRQISYIIFYKKAVLSQRWPRDASYSLWVPLIESDYRVKLNRVFFPHLTSPKFPHVSLGLGRWPLSYEERRCWANCPCDY